MNGDNDGEKLFQKRDQMESLTKRRTLVHQWIYGVGAGMGLQTRMRMPWVDSK